MIKQPPYLKKGDKIAIVCPASKLRNPVGHAVKILEKWGLQVVLGATVHAEDHQFAGDDALRTADLQQFLDDPSVKAILAGRGGYGMIRIIDQLDFTAFRQSPKWIAGFSDITLLLSHLLAVLDTQSIHSVMPGSFESSTPEALESLRKALFGEELRYHFQSDEMNRTGEATGILTGGNLSMLMAAAGSLSAVDFTAKILFIEDVGEPEYAVDRMLRSLQRAGKLSGLKGLIAGAFNGVRPDTPPFGQTIPQLVMEIVKTYDYPVCFGFPAGHIDGNQTLVLGQPVRLTTGLTGSELMFL